jgi:signal transduction histidine kinase/CheY-like chemotaxis protein
MDSTEQALETRVLILAPTVRDGALTLRLLSEAGITAQVCSDIASVNSELTRGAGAAILPEEFLADSGAARLRHLLEQQPSWSDLPILILSRPGADSASVALTMEMLGNVTVLERPMRVSALVSTVRTAIRARRRQYEIREQLLERQRAREALQLADRRKDEFLAMLAHELRNPLAPICSSLNYLRVAEVRDPALSQVYDILERQIKQLVRLVDDLLDISRITRGRIELKMERVELSTILRSAIETSRPLIDAGGHRLTINLPDEALYVDGDPTRLAQAISNLLNNAAKYTNDGGQIWLSGHVADGQAVITVQDTGVGIARDRLPSVFELFTQLDSSRNRRQGGLGIGLTLVRRLVESHGGSVEAHSDGPDQGSQFTVRLPLVDVSTTPSAPVAGRAVDEPLTQSKRILVVDDNKDAARTMAMLLKACGGNVQTAYSGAEALEAISTATPDVVVMDIGMPEMDGYEVARRIRESVQYQDIQLIALSGWGQPEDRRRAYEAGFDHHLTKPMDFSALRQLITAHDVQPT